MLDICVSSGSFYAMMAIATFLYVFAGHQTYRLVSLLDPGRSECPIQMAQERGEDTTAAYVLFILTYPFLFAIAKVASNRM